MSLPNKRRKTNNYKPSPKPLGSLDFFFEKQKDRQEQGKRDDNIAEGPSDRVQTQDRPPTDQQNLTDEELARKLQDEWDQQEKVRSGVVAEEAPSEPVEDSSAEVRKVETAGAEVVKPPLSSDYGHRAVQGSEAQGRTSSGKRDTLALQSTASAEGTVSTIVPFDENPLTFNPSKFIPGLQKQWTEIGGDASYGILTRCFILINSTQSRIKIVDTLVNFLRILIEGDPESLLPAVSLTADVGWASVLRYWKVWLATNSISPPYVSLELGLGGSAISKALKRICGLDNAGLKTLYDKHGDAGDVAFEAKKRQSFTLRKPKPLSIKGVFQSLVRIANSKGTGSQEFKQRIVERLLQDSQGAEESRYLVRTLVQHLRIGAVKTTMLIALSRAFLLSRPPNAGFPVTPQDDLIKLKKDGLAEVYSKGEELVKASFSRRPNYNDLVPCLLEVGISDELLVRCGLAMGIPLRPMLGSITRDLGEMLTKLQGRDFSCEYKYDGQRAQVHCDENGKVSIFSRHLESMVEKYPDLVQLVPTIRGEGVSSFILEGEVVAVDKASGDLKAFQTLTNRARKDVDIGSIKVDVCLFAFDLMYLNGEELLNRSFRERRELLRSLFVELPNRFTWVKNLDATSADSETVLEFFKSAIEIKCEGIMVKVLDNVLHPVLAVEAQEDRTARSDVAQKASKAGKKAKGKGTASDKAEEKAKGTRRKALLATYEPDKRLDSWLKVKKDYNTSADTIDLIPIAGWHGQGRKAKWWSPILLAVRNPETGSLEAVTKCISGFTDKFYQVNKERYAEGSKNVIARPSYVEYNGSPEVWFEPQEVWEMAFADITKSPTYLAALGMVDEDRGLSMRFPRFLKAREDKSIDEASTSDFLAELWRKQELRVKREDAQGGDAEEEDEL